MIGHYSIYDLKREFGTEEQCLEFVFASLHRRKCSCGGIYRPMSTRKQYQCGSCHYQIAPTAGTIFHKSSTPLVSWFHAIFIFSNAKSGISAKELQRQLGVTYKCAWRILSQIKKALRQDNGKLSGEVETDTTFIGGVGLADKGIVMVAVERGGRLKAKVVKSTNAVDTFNFVRKNIRGGSRLYTDSAPSFTVIDRYYKRRKVNHSRKEYSRGKAHVNTVEAFFGHLKRSIRGTHKVISRRHLQSYLDAFAFHYNNRYSDRKRFETLIDALVNA